MSYSYKFEIRRGDKDSDDLQLTAKHPGNQDFFLTTRTDNLEDVTELYYLDLVSAPFPFNARSCVYPGVWQLIGENVKGMVTDRRSLVKGLEDLEDAEKRSGIRIAMCSVNPLTANNFLLADGNWNKPTGVQMKVQVFSNISQKAAREDKEKGCLAKLVRLCGGAQNLTLEMSGMRTSSHYGTVNYPNESLAPPNFIWSEEHLMWEALVPVAFLPIELFDLRNGIPTFGTGIGTLGFKLNDGGVASVLQKVYGNPGSNWHLQKNLLEQRTFSDLVILSEHQETEGETPIPCHRSQLASASQVFADMLKESNGWEEAKQRTIKLPESEDAINAMLHFLYYGGTEKIFRGRADVAVELLQAAHKYDIPNLEELTTFVLLRKHKADSWWSVDVALELFCFARNLEGRRWTSLKVQAYDVLCAQPKEELSSSEGFQKLRDVAKKLGPAFEAALEGNCTEDCMPVSILDLPKEEAGLLFDYLCCSSVNHCLPANFGIAVALMAFADQCKRQYPFDVEDVTDSMFFQQANRRFGVDYLVELFCLARTMECVVWNKLKLEAVKKLKWFVINRPAEIEASAKYDEMFRTNYAAAKEYSKIGIESGTGAK